MDMAGHGGSEPDTTLLVGASRELGLTTATAFVGMGWYVVGIVDEDRPCGMPDVAAHS
ncbi:hypothetical protein ACU5AX_13215 [Sphingomonas sp. XXL09]|uniref:hypothetical protein n=1 Tax=Sphingomonas sp. XXL09 TaxID=3457787 RepID=UPI00406BAACA